MRRPTERACISPTTAHAAPLLHLPPAAQWLAASRGSLTHRNHCTACRVGACPHRGDPKGPPYNASSKAPCRVGACPHRDVALCKESRLPRQCAHWLAMTVENGSLAPTAVTPRGHPTMHRRTRPVGLGLAPTAMSRFAKKADCHASVRTGSQ